MYRLTYKYLSVLNGKLSTPKFRDFETKEEAEAMARQEEKFGGEVLYIRKVTK